MFALMGNSAVARSITYRMDRLNGSHYFEEVYKARLFRDSSSTQKQSILLSLPTEIRLLIYDYILALSQKEKSSTALAFLATCRLVHGEAYKKAFQNFEFRLNGDKGLVFHKKIWNLGSLQKLLRHIKVTMLFKKLDAHGGNNPFVLTMLSLDTLVIDFGRIETYSWRTEVVVYHRLISALLYRSSPKQLGNATTPIHESILGKRKRDLEIATWQFSPQRKELYDVMFRFATKKLVVRADGDFGSDIMWSAFSHFDLVDHYITKTKTGGVQTGHWEICYLMFGDEGALPFFEIGKMIEPLESLSP